MGRLCVFPILMEFVKMKIRSMITFAFVASIFCGNALAQETQPSAPAAPAAAPAVQPSAKTLPDGRPIADCLTPIEGMSCIPGGSFIRGADNDVHKNCNQSSYNKAYVSKEHKEAKDYRNNYPQQTIWIQT